MIEAFLKYNSGLTLLVAPPAWGKTQILKKLFSEKDHYFIFVSPLRALANEFYQNIQQDFSVLNIEKCADWKKLNEQQIIIVTPELFQEQFVALFESRQVTIVLDEFHLYFYWGMSFREEMWRLLTDVCSLPQKKIIGLTATLSLENQQLLREQFIAFDQPVTVINLGNQCLKNFPNRVCYLPSHFKNCWYWFVSAEDTRTTLIFCRYRNEVRKNEEVLRSLGFNVLSCLGGEAPDFGDQLKINPKPQIIVSTTVLSHGVNLPPIGKIIFTYPVNNFDFWIQMVGRGGRKGESFQVITYDNFFSNKWLKLRSFFTILTKYMLYHLTWD